MQHGQTEGPYAIADALEAAGLQLRVARVYAGDPLPATTAGLAALVVMGGEMAAHSDGGFPTRRAELALLEDAIDRGLPTLGICLGAQLLAVAGGGRAYPGGVLEVGWAPVTLLPAAASDPLTAGLPARFEVLHWHRDTLDPPPGSATLARSVDYAQQFVRIGERAWGIQFHLEVDAAAVAAWVADAPQEAEQAPGGRARLEERTPECLEALAPVRGTVLGRFAALAAEAEPA